MKTIITDILAATGWTQTELAMRAGCGRLTIHTYLHGRSRNERPSYGVLSPLLKIHAEVCATSNSLIISESNCTIFEKSQSAVNQQ